MERRRSEAPRARRYPESPTQNLRGDSVRWGMDNLTQERNQGGKTERTQTRLMTMACVAILITPTRKAAYIAKVRDYVGSQ